MVSLQGQQCCSSDSLFSLSTAVLSFLPLQRNFKIISSISIKVTHYNFNWNDIECVDQAVKNGSYPDASENSWYDCDLIESWSLPIAPQIISHSSDSGNCWSGISVCHPHIWNHRIENEFEYAIPVGHYKKRMVFPCSPPQNWCTGGVLLVPRNWEGSSSACQGHSTLAKIKAALEKDLQVPMNGNMCTIFSD